MIPTGRELVAQLIDLDPDQRRAVADGLQPALALLSSAPQARKIVEALEHLLRVLDDPLTADVWAAADRLDAAMGA